MKLSSLFRFALVLMVLALFASDSFARCGLFGRLRERRAQHTGHVSGNCSNTTTSASGCGIGGCPVGK